MKQDRFALVVAEIFTFILLLIFFTPFALVIINAGKLSTQITSYPLQLPTHIIQYWTNITRIMTDTRINYLGGFIHSIIITSVSLVAIGIFSGMAAWVLVRTKTKYSTFIFMFFLSGMVIPFQVVMLPLVRFYSFLDRITGIQFLDSYQGIIIAYIAFGAPLSIFLFHGFIKSIPMDIEEAAIIDGCTKSQLFFQIVLPILKPIFVTLLVLNGLWIWNDYLLPVLIIGTGGNLRTLPLSVAKLAGAYVRQWDLILTSVLLAALPVIILFFFAQKHIIRGMTSGAIK